MISAAAKLPLLLAVAGLLVGPAAAAQNLEALAGTWAPAPQAGGPGGVTRVVAAPVLDGSWLRLTTREPAPGGGELAETLMLAQAADGSVSAYLFRAGAVEALRLAGRWSDDGGLELAGADGESWSWVRRSDCEAELTRRSPRPAGAGRPPASRLRREDCEPTRTAAAPDPRPPATQAPAEPVAEEPAAVEVAVADLPAARPDPATRAEASGERRTVLIAGRGKPYEEVQKTVERLREFLGARGVAVEGPSDDIVVLQAADSSLAYLLREVRDRGAASLLWVTAAYGGRERIVVECFDTGGNQLWSERTLGGTAWRRFEQMNPQLLDRIEKKLEPRIGGAGLPVGEP